MPFRTAGKSQRRIKKKEKRNKGEKKDWIQKSLFFSSLKSRHSLCVLLVFVDDHNTPLTASLIFIS